ncbi:hypothetical protein Q4488_18775, partial [Amphritea sp. 1_MG-2023]|uniref:hypothetical protein n=1 Tax=Amphritea sp. 1_MG-2023 TaxID=3062670 RepID=UPI0026E296F9
EGRILEWSSTLSASLKRSRHFAALASAYLTILMSAENITDLFAPSLDPVCVVLILPLYLSADAGRRAIA